VELETARVGFDAHRAWVDAVEAAYRDLR